MLPKKNRADKKAIEEIFKKGKVLQSPILTFRFLISSANKNPQPRIPRISIVVPKTVSKKAVDRNLLRRRGYEVLEKYLNVFPVEIIGVFVFKKYSDDILILSNEIENLLHKIN